MNPVAFDESTSRILHHLDIHTVCSACGMSKLLGTLPTKHCFIELVNYEVRRLDERHSQPLSDQYTEDNLRETNPRTSCPSAM